MHVLVIALSLLPIVTKHRPLHKLHPIRSHSLLAIAPLLFFFLKPFEACDIFKWMKDRNDDDSFNNNYFVFLSVIFFCDSRLFELLFLHFSCLKVLRIDESSLQWPCGMRKIYIMSNDNTHKCLTTVFYQVHFLACSYSQHYIL
jgi:hypothetical protein